MIVPFPFPSLVRVSRGRHHALIYASTARLLRPERLVLAGDLACFEVAGMWCGKSLDNEFLQPTPAEVFGSTSFGVRLDVPAAFGFSLLFKRTKRRKHRGTPTLQAILFCRASNWNTEAF